MARLTLFALFLAGTLFILGPTPAARAQTIDWLAGQSGLVVSHQPGSARLEAMGNLEVSVADENRELNLLDYGRNICGYLTDSDYRRWDLWQHSNEAVHDVRDADGIRTRTRARLSEYGGRMAWRSGSTRVLGGDFIYDDVQASVERGPNTKVRGPLWGVFAAQKVSRLTLGGAVRFGSDNEDLTSESVFAIRHEGSSVQGTGGLVVDLGKFQVSGQVEAQSNTITGLSRDENRFHEDKLTWKRPVEIYDISAFYKPTERVTGAVRARFLRVDGREQVEISWSDRMPDNPSRTNFLATTGTFDESQKGTEVGTRWEALAAKGVRVGARVDYAKLEDTVVEGKNYKGSRRAQDTSETYLTGGGGASYETAGGRLRIGAEGWVTTRDSDVVEIDKTVTTNAIQSELRTGAEYFLDQHFVLRAGYRRVAYDSDRDEPRSLQIGNGLSAGLGFVGRGGLYQIDAGIRMLNMDPDYSGFPNAEDSTTSILLGVRFLL